MKNRLILYLTAPDSTAAENKLKKNKFIILIAAIAFLVILLSAFWIIPQIQLQTNLASTPAVGSIQSVAGYYLTSQGNESKIFVVSANASYGYYPYHTQTNLNGSVVFKGEPCIIINVTIRNDYSTQYSPFPPQNSNPNNRTLVFVDLTAQLFSGKNQIQGTTDLLRVGLPPDAGASAYFSSGENATLSIYLATNSKDVTSFQIVTVLLRPMPD
ncbi:MAG: hypothetical protein ABSA75_03040 [Candidatus Bathyarchaeia archaeon]